MPAEEPQLDPRRVTIEEHLRRPWRVHGLLDDFDVEDVWRLPIDLAGDESIAWFRDQAMQALPAPEGAPLVRLLFRIRFAVGGALGWDPPIDHSGLRPGSIRERYAVATGLAAADLPAPGDGDFATVYETDSEYLSEIDNKTVHAALHLGKVAVGDGRSAVHLAVYAKPKGRLGRAYMAVIRPFRRRIVYPRLLQLAGDAWEAHRSGT